MAELEPGLNFIEDCFQCSGQLLLASLIKSGIKSGRFVDAIICSLESDPKRWFSHSDNPCTSSEKVLDLRTKLFDSLDIFEEISGFVEKNVSSNSLIAFDSLHLLEFASLPKTPSPQTSSDKQFVIRFLHKLSRNGEISVVILAHKELVFNKEPLVYVASSWHELCVDRKRNLPVCKSKIRKHHGKVATKSFIFDIDPWDLTLKLGAELDTKTQERRTISTDSDSKEKSEWRKPTKVVLTEQKKPETGIKVPFSLNLTEAERAAKEHLTLPYTQIKHISLQDTAQVKIHGLKTLEQPGSGLVHYLPDEADDLDDSDPDEDLNI